MPRDVSALGNEEKKAYQHPVSLVYFGIGGSWGPILGNDTDITLYLNRSTNATSLVPVVGYDAFPPMADLSVPTVEQSDQAALSDVSINASNVNQLWYAVMADNHFRDCPVTIWAGNIAQGVTASPDDISFVGAVTLYVGRIDSISATNTLATINVVAHASPWKMFLPNQAYSPDSTARFGGFRKIPVVGTKLVWGWTEKTL